MAWKRRLSGGRREELRAGSNHFGEQAARAFLDGAVDVALGSSDRAIRDHEELLRDGPDDEEIVAVLADRLRDRVEIRRHMVVGDVHADRPGRGGGERRGGPCRRRTGDRAVRVRRRGS